MVLNWSVIWFRFHYLLHLLWDYLASLGSKFADSFSCWRGRRQDIPFPATSSKAARPCRVNLAFPLPTFTRSSRHSQEFEASQRRLRHSIRLQKTAFRIPKRCTTPLLPFHAIPGLPNDEDEDLILTATRPPWHENCGSSLSSSPSLSLHTPLSTTNAFQAADPFADRGDPFYTPPDPIGVLHSPFVMELEVLPKLAPSDVKHVSTNASGAYRNPIDDRNSPTWASRRQFCGCKKLCSEYAAISPPLRLGAVPLTIGLDTLGIHSTRATSMQRRHSFGGDSVRDTWRPQTLLDDPLLSGLELVLPRSLDPPRKTQRTSEAYIPCDSRSSSPGRQKVIPEPPSAHHRSSAYDAWMTSWCFRPAILRSPLPEILVSSSPQFDLNFLPLSTSSPRVSVLEAGQANTISSMTPHAKRLTHLSPSSGLLSRHSRVLSGMNKVQNLRDLLAVLDQTMAASAATQDIRLSKSSFEWEELNWEDVDSMWRLGSEAVAGRAL
ncbi:hypothetical protein AN958_11087 [Leucoagaricus sp. SymC.cos]|nr:hypothetical protein AN958_11087 [Leucoagaricus sp. SymC.cos]